MRLGFDIEIVGGTGPGAVDPTRSIRRGWPTRLADAVAALGTFVAPSCGGWGGGMVDA